MRLTGDCWGPGWGGLERSMKEENLSGLVWDVADQGGNGIQNEARHPAEGAGHPGKAKERRGTPLGQQGSLGWKVETGGWGAEMVVSSHQHGPSQAFSGYCHVRTETPNLPSCRSLCGHWGPEGCVGPRSSQVCCGDGHTSGAGADFFLHGEQW